MCFFEQRNQILVWCPIRSLLESDLIKSMYMFLENLTGLMQLIRDHPSWLYLDVVFTCFIVFTLLGCDFHLFHFFLKFLYGSRYLFSGHGHGFETLEDFYMILTYNAVHFLVEHKNCIILPILLEHLSTLFYSHHT